MMGNRCANFRRAIAIGVFGGMSESGIAVARRSSAAEGRRDIPARTDPAMLCRFVTQEAEHKFTPSEQRRLRSGAVARPTVPSPATGRWDGADLPAPGRDGACALHDLHARRRVHAGLSGLVGFDCMGFRHRHRGNRRQRRLPAGARGSLAGGFRRLLRAALMGGMKSKVTSGSTRTGSLSAATAPAAGFPPASARRAAICRGPEMRAQAIILATQAP